MLNFIDSGPGNGQYGLHNTHAAIFNSLNFRVEPVSVNKLYRSIRRYLLCFETKKKTDRRIKIDRFNNWNVSFLDKSSHQHNLITVITHKYKS